MDYVSHAFLADRHSGDFEIHEGCKLFAQWFRPHLETLAPLIERHTRAYGPSLGAAAVAVVITMLAVLLSNSSHPHAAATTLLIALGALHTQRMH